MTWIAAEKPLTRHKWPDRGPHVIRTDDAAASRAAQAPDISVARGARSNGQLLPAALHGPKGCHRWLSARPLMAQLGVASAFVVRG